MTTRMVSADDAGDIFTPQPDTKIAHLAEVAALQQMTDTLGRMGKFMQQLGEEQKALTSKVSDMHTDIALLRQSNERIEKLEALVSSIATRVGAIEMTHAEQNGAAKFVGALKDFGPWIFALLTALWALLERSPK